MLCPFWMCGFDSRSSYFFMLLWWKLARHARFRLWCEVIVACGLESHQEYNIFMVPQLNRIEQHVSNLQVEGLNPSGITYALVMKLGIHASFKIWCLRACGFDSHRGYTYIYAPVFQWSECRSPKPKIVVRFHFGVQSLIYI